MHEQVDKIPEHSPRVKEAHGIPSACDIQAGEATDPLLEQGKLQISCDDGLVKGAYVGTEAAATVVMHVTKLVVYRQVRVLSEVAVFVGLSLAPLMVAGSWVGKRIVDRMPARVFEGVIELTMVVAGVLFLVRD